MKNFILNVLLRKPTSSHGAGFIVTAVRVDPSQKIIPEIHATVPVLVRQTCEI